MDIFKQDLTQMDNIYFTQSLLYDTFEPFMISGKNEDCNPFQAYCQCICI